MLRQVARAVETDHRHDPAGEHGPDDLAFLVRRNRCVGHGKPRLVAENLRLETLELWAGLDPELVDEAGACILVHLQGLCLPARTIQREHQLSPERLAKRVVADECLELADDVAVAPELEVGVDSLPMDDEPQLFESPDLRLREVVKRELGERRPAPERERLLKAVAPLLWRKSTAVGESSLEAARVDLIRLNPEDVAG